MNKVNLNEAKPGPKSNQAKTEQITPQQRAKQSKQNNKNKKTYIYISTWFRLLIDNKHEPYVFFIIKKKKKNTLDTLK